MKAKILEALKTKFTGVSDTILNRIAGNLAKTVTTEDAVQTAVDAVTFQQIIDGEGDRRATEATNSAVSNYEKKHSLKEGKPVDQGGGQGIQTEPDKNKTPDESGDKVTAASIAAAAAAIKPLSDEITAMKTGKISDERKLKLDAVISKLPYNLKKPYNRISLKDMADDEFETFITETTTEVDTLAADYAAKGAVLKTPMGGGKTDTEASKEEAAKVVEGLI
jgi:hypothetical protein